MAVIALARFIVIAQHAFAGDDQGQTVLEPVCRPLDGKRHTPDNDLCEGILGEDMAFVGQRLCLHVGEYTNKWSVVTNSNTAPMGVVQG